MTKEKGFTLTETLVVVVVFTVVMSLSLTVFLGSIRTQRAALFQQRLVSESTYALSRVEEDIKKGERDDTNINKNYIRGFINEDAISIEHVDTAENNGRITVLLETSINLDEERKLNMKLQTTVNPQ
jgi:prepilin-type N-terminal cleavage/methylation domain-containing protein